MRPATVWATPPSAEQWTRLSRTERSALVLDAYLHHQEREELADRLSSPPRWRFAVGPSLASAVVAMLISCGSVWRLRAQPPGSSAASLPQQIVVTWGNSSPQPFPPAPISTSASVLLWILTLASRPIDDPGAYTKPWSFPLQWEFFADTDIIEDVCENEKDAAHAVGK